MCKIVIKERNLIQYLRFVTIYYKIIYTLVYIYFILIIDVILCNVFIYLF